MEDSASSQKGVVDVVERSCGSFYIRAKRCAKLDYMIGSFPKEGWEKIRLGIREMEVSCIVDYRPFGGEKPHRLVISRIRRRETKTDMFSGKAYSYRGILINDTETSNGEVVDFYNAQRESECLFNVMNKGFGWAKMPCSFLSENTAIMIMAAIYGNFYRYLIGEYSKKLSCLKPNFRLKKFKFSFITVAGKWTRTGRRFVFKPFTEKDYGQLLTKSQINSETNT